MMRKGAKYTNLIWEPIPKIDGGKLPTKCGVKALEDKLPSIIYHKMKIKDEKRLFKMSFVRMYA